MFLKKDMKNQRKTGRLTIISIPGTSKPWFVYDKKTHKSSQGFRSYKAAAAYIKAEFPNL